MDSKSRLTGFNSPGTNGDSTKRRKILEFILDLANEEYKQTKDQKEKQPHKIDEEGRDKPCPSAL